MGFYSYFFRSNNLPPSVWDSGVLYLPEPLAAAHKEFLVSNGLLNERKVSGYRTFKTAAHVLF